MNTVTIGARLGTCGVVMLMAAGCSIVSYMGPPTTPLEDLEFGVLPRVESEGGEKSEVALKTHAPLALAARSLVGKGAE